jgi:acetyl esterase/lipase
MLTLDQMIWFWKLYLQDHDATSCSTNFKICPINAPKNILSQFPNTLIVLAKYDVLYSEGTYINI